MIKKCILALSCCSIFSIHAGQQEHKETPKKTGLSFSGTVPIEHRIDIKSEGLVTAVTALEKIKLLDAQEFTKAVEILSKSKALADAAAQLKEVKINVDPKDVNINVTSEALHKAAQALRTIELNHNVTIKIECPTCGLGRLAGYIGTAYQATSSVLRAQLNRCCSRKKQEEQNDLSIDPLPEVPLIKTHRN